MHSFVLDSAQTFSFYCVGDALYLSRVINGIAMISNSGLLITLGTIGMLLGLIRAGFVAVSTNGKQIELSHLFASLLFFMCMFGVRADVKIVDVLGPPFGNEGVATPSVISNVPYGVAVAGWAISSFGYNLAEKFEQGFAVPGSGFGGVTNGGFGKGLAWINAVRNLDIPEINDETGTVGVFKKNLTSYLARCFLPAVQRGKASVESAFTVKNIFSPASNVAGAAGGGILVEDLWSGIDWDAGNGSTFQSCTEAGQRLQLMSRHEFYSATAEALTGRALKWAGVAQGQLDDAFNQIGIASNEARAYVANMAVSAVWNDAVRVGSFSSMDALSSIMISQAKQARASQWAADEDMWKSTAKGFSAFFEGMLFACAPFMALALGIGPWGHKVVFRYLILTAWVALWLPVLAIINLFQVTTIEHAVDALRLATGYGTDTSLATTMMLSSKIVDWIAVGSALAAATPVITLSLLMGGAITATALASRMSGGDHVNERIHSPEVTNAAPAMTDSSIATRDSASGLRTTGSDNMIPVINMSSVHGVNERGAQSEAWQASRTATAEQSRIITSSLEHGHSFAHEAASGSSTTYNEAMARFAGAAKASNVNLGNESTSAYALASSLVAQGGTATKAGISTPGGGNIAYADLGFSGSVTSKGEISERIQNINKLAAGMNQNTQIGHELRYNAVQGLNETVGVKSAVSMAEKESTQGADSYKQALNEAATSAKSYENAVEIKDTFGMQQNQNVAQVATTVNADGKGDDLMRAAILYGPGGEQGLRTQANAIADTPWGKNGDPALRRSEAALIQLQRSALDASSPYRMEAAAALTQFVRGSGGVALGSDAQGSPTDFRTGGSGVRQGDVFATTGGQPLGSGTSDASVRGGAAGVASPGNYSANEARVAGEAGVGVPDTGRLSANHAAMYGDPDRIDEQLRDYVTPDLMKQDADSQDQHDAAAIEQKAATKDSTTAWLAKVDDSSVAGNAIMEAVRFQGMGSGWHAGSNISPDNAAAMTQQAIEAGSDPQVLAKYGFSSGVANESVARAIGVLSVADQHGVATDEMGRIFDQATSDMSPTQKNAMLRFIYQGTQGETAADRDIYTALSGKHIPGKTPI